LRCHLQIRRHRPPGHQQLEAGLEGQVHQAGLGLPASRQRLRTDGDLEARRQGQAQDATGAAVQGGNPEAGGIERQRPPALRRRRAAAARAAAASGVVAEAGPRADRQAATGVGAQFKGVQGGLCGGADQASGGRKRPARRTASTTAAMP
jgi:hypothetical protein